MIRKKKQNQNKVRRGYPRKRKFKTMEEVNAYFDEDHLTCLLCGNLYASLHKHVQMAHDISAEEYKEEFGLPWRRGLISRLLREKQSAIMNKQKEEGIVPYAPSPAHMKILRASLAHRRPLPDVVREAQRQHALRTHGRTEKWGRKDFEEYLRRIESGRTITEVGEDDDMPCREVFTEYMRQNPSFKSRFEKIWDQLPFAVQIRAIRTGPRFKRRVIVLRERGYSWPQIGRIMEVSEGVVRGTWHRLKKKNKLSIKDL